MRRIGIMNDNLIEFAKLLFRNDQAAIAIFGKACSDGLDFYENHGNEIGVDIRYIRKLWNDNTYPRHILLWDLLIDVGILFHCVCEVDYREYYDQIVEGIKALKPAQGLQIAWTEIAETDPDTPINGFIQDLAAKLRVYGEVLVVLDKQSDSFPFALLSEVNLNDAKNIAENFDTGRLVIVREEEFE
jgi:hypothetical protein